MTPLQTALLVAGILVGTVGMFILVMIPISLRMSSLARGLRSELEAKGQPIVRGPERAAYQGATADYSKVRGAGVVALTTSQLLFRPVIGRAIEVPLDQIVGVREDKWFRRGYRSGRLHAILKLRSGAEVAFILPDHPAWMTAFQGIAQKQATA